jgi:hypothetical protein
METLGLTDFLREMNLDGVDDPEELFGFAWVTSPFSATGGVLQ